MHSSLPLQITDWKFQSQSARQSNFFQWVERVSVRGEAAVVAILAAFERELRKPSPRTCVPS